MFKIDAHDLFNQRLGLQYLIYDSSKINCFSDKIRLFRMHKAECLQKPYFKLCKKIYFKEKNKL